MTLRVVQAIKEKIPGMVGDYPSSAKIYRERGGTPKLEETGAIRIRYDELPDMHKIETGEETKAVDLEAIIEKYESDDPDDALYLVEGVPTPDGEKDLVLEGVKDYDSGSRIGKAAEKIRSIHRVETDEGAEPMKLSEMVEKFESEGPEYADYVVAGVQGPDGEKRDMLLREVVSRGQIQEMDTFDGTPTVHFYEAESGQLINWLPKFVDNEDLDGDIHRAVAGGDTERYDVNEKTVTDENGKPQPSQVGIRPYLIDNKDERLTAWMDHLKRKYEKYQGSGGFWENHFEIAVILAVGLSVAMIYYAVLGNIGDLVPVFEQFAGELGGTREALENIVQEQTGGGGTPPPGN